MGIDVYSKRNGETLPFSYSYEDPNYDSFDTWFDEYRENEHGYIREAYFKSQAYPTRCLLEEAFEGVNCGKFVPIPLDTLKSRYDEMLELANERFDDMLSDGYYKESQREEFLDIYKKFVDRAEKIEKETGKPMEVYASW